MTTLPSTIPSELDGLPEPVRAKAHHVYLQLLEEGTAKADAIHQARELAAHWVAERVKAPEEQD